MLPRLVPEISPLDAFCDGAAAGAGAAVIGDSRSWITGGGVGTGSEDLTHIQTFESKNSSDLLVGGFPHDLNVQ